MTKGFQSFSLCHLQNSQFEAFVVWTSLAGCSCFSQWSECLLESSYLWGQYSISTLCHLIHPSTRVCPISLANCHMTLCHLTAPRKPVPLLPTETSSVSPLIQAWLFLLNKSLNALLCVCLLLCYIFGKLISWSVYGTWEQMFLFLCSWLCIVLQVALSLGNQLPNTCNGTQHGWILLTLLNFPSSLL